jgi:predicted DNA-binding transcriptional regulator YafY
MNTRAATFASKRQRAMGLGDTRPTFRRLGVIAGKLRRDLTLPSCARLGVELECSYKTIQRDIDLLRDFFGYPLEYDASKYQYKLAGPLPKAVL